MIDYQNWQISKWPPLELFMVDVAGEEMNIYEGKWRSNKLPINDKMWIKTITRYEIKVLLSLASVFPVIFV